MSSSEAVRAIHRACSRAIRLLCKGEGDIPEVEAIIVLILGRLGPFWEAQATGAVEEILRKLRRLQDALPTASVDFVAGADEDDPAREVFVAALLGALERRLSAPPTPWAQEALQGLSESLLDAGAGSTGQWIDWAQPSAAGLPESAEADLLLQLRGRYLTRREAVRGHLEAYLARPEVRRDSEAWARQLADLLGVDVTDWLPVTVDAWAYRWYNIARVVSYAQAGVRTLVLWNPRDQNTTPFCWWAHGYEVPVGLALEHIDRYEQAVSTGDMDKAMKIWPLQEPSKFNRATYLSHHPLPPFHFRCRTEVRPKEGESVR